MNLQGIVCGAPGHASAEELGHACFKVTAPAFVLRAGGSICELPRHHDFNSHPGKLSGNPRELDDRSGKLNTVQRITKAEFHGILRNAERAGRRLDTGAFKSLHQLLEAISFFFAQKVFCLDFEIIETELIFLHTSVAEHFDFTTGHSLGRKIFCFRHMRLFSKEHGKALISRLIRVRPHQHGHYVGTRRMGDPGLVASHLINIPILHRAGFQRRQV